MKNADYSGGNPSGYGRNLTEAGQAGFELSNDEFKSALLSELSEVKNASTITRLVDIGQEKTKEGLIHRFGFETAAGYAYAAMVGLAKHANTDVSGIGSSAWLTSTEGLNEHTIRKFMEAGNNMIFVGAEGSFHSGRLSRPKQRLTLAGSAAATLSFSELIAYDYQDDMHISDRFAIGESRGAMAGMGMLAMDELFNQDIIFADLTAPCFPIKFSIKDMPELAEQLYHESVSVAKLVGKLTLKNLIHYPSTVDLHPYSLIHQALIGPALFGGNAGELAQLIQKDKIGYVTCFDNDKASMKPHWMSIFENHPNIKVTPLKGSHLAIADPQTLAFLLLRNKYFQEAYLKKGRDLTGDDIFIPAQNMADEILSQTVS